MVSENYVLTAPYGHGKLPKFTSRLLSFSRKGDGKKT